MSKQETGAAYWASYLRQATYWHGPPEVSQVPRYASLMDVDWCSRRERGECPDADFLHLWRTGAPAFSAAGKCGRAPTALCTARGPVGALVRIRVTKASVELTNFAS